MATVTSAAPRDIPVLALEVANDAVRRVDRGVLSRRLAIATHRRSSHLTVGATISDDEIRALTLLEATLGALRSTCRLNVAGPRVFELQRDVAKILTALD